MQAHAQERRRKEAADEAAKAAAEEAAKEAAKALHKKSKAAKESSQNSRLRSKRAEADVQLPEGSSRLSALSRSLSRKGSQKKVCAPPFLHSIATFSIPCPASPSSSLIVP
jgi:hypothetical protein